MSRAPVPPGMSAASHRHTGANIRPYATGAYMASGCVSYVTGITALRNSLSLPVDEPYLLNLTLQCPRAPVQVKALTALGREAKKLTSIRQSLLRLWTHGAQH